MLRRLRHLARAVGAPRCADAGEDVPAAQLLPGGQLDDATLARFEEDGFLCFPNFLSAQHASRIVEDMGTLPLLGEGPGRGSGPMECLRFRTSGLGGFPTMPKLVALVESVMGGRRFAMNHLNAHMAVAGENGNSWHHDYPSGPPGDPYTLDHAFLDRERRMVHVLCYPDGLSGEVGDLLLLPKSHRAILPADEVMTPLFPDSPDLPGSLTIDYLPKGAVTLCHSALLHARRPKPSVDSATARFLLTTAFCEYAHEPDRRFAAHVDSFNPQGEPNGHTYTGSKGWPMAEFCKVALEHGQHRPNEAGGGSEFVFDNQKAFRSA
jgi:hypothetical protein